MVCAFLMIIADVIVFILTTSFQAQRNLKINLKIKGNYNCYSELL